VLGALFAVFVGERILPDASAMRLVLSGVGAAMLLVGVAWRAAAWRRATGDARAVERVFLLAYAGCALAVALFFLAGGLGERIGFAFTEAGAQRRLETALTVLGTVLLCASLLPALAAQWSAGPGYSAGSATASVDRLRITQVALAALTVGLAAPFLVLTGYVAGDRDKTLDVSYFRTSSPGTASQQIVGALGGPLRVLLFFPPSSDVTDQLRGYFRALGAEGGTVRLEEFDRLVSPDTVQKYGVVRDGIVVLAAEDRTERIALPVSLEDARLQLRTLDEDVQQSLMRLSREERTVYLTVGHGELNDQSSARATDTLAISSGTFAVSSLLGYLNYAQRELGVRAGLGNEVPQDAAMVLVLGPRRPFLEAELRTLERYLLRGGSVLFALEPDSEFELGPLADLLGVDFRRVPVVDDQNYVRFQDNLSDRTILVTDRVFSHASTSTVSQGGIGDGMVFMGAGYLEPKEEGGPGLTVIARSMPSAFADSTRDFELTGETEFRQQLALAVAVDAPAGPQAASASPDLRALVFADSELFSDLVLSRVGLNQALLADALLWLGREEELAGETASEADVPIVHTRAENVAWFYSTILGAPALVLALGLLGVRRRRVRHTEVAA
jgi:hypothetical protein